MDRLKEILRSNRGVLQTSDAVSAGVAKDTLYRFVDSHGLEKVAHGIFIDPNEFIDEMYLLQLQFPKIIFSHETALYLHGLAEREPSPLAVTVPIGYRSVALVEKGTAIRFCKPEWFPLGTTTMDSPAGYPIRVYDPERTICDVVRRRNKMDVSAFNYAVRQHISSGSCNYVRLLEYAKELQMEQLLRNVIGVLL